MRYATTIQLNAGVGGLPSTHLFNAASIYDPDRTGAGHQPFGRDEISALYDNYVVLGSKCIARFFSHGTGYDEQASGLCGIRLHSTIATQTSRDTLMEDPETRFTTHGLGRMPTVSSRYSARRMFHSKDIYGDDKLVASVSSNPTHDPTFQVFVAAEDSTDNNYVTAYVTIDYIVAFIRPNTLTGS